MQLHGANIYTVILFEFFIMMGGSQILHPGMLQMTVASHVGIQIKIHIKSNNGLQVMFVYSAVPVTVFFLQPQKSYLSRLTEIQQALKMSEFFKQHEVMFSIGSQTVLDPSDKLKYSFVDTNRCLKCVLLAKI